MNKNEKIIKKIVLTGGPCSGKSTSLEIIKKHFEKDWKILVIPETCTELTLNGYSPASSTLEKFEHIAIKTQLEKEKRTSEIANILDDSKILIICDRGLPDCLAYLDLETREKFIQNEKINTDQLINRYDAVIHLETTAKSDLNSYTIANNEARTEDAKQAIDVDNRVINEWIGHPHLRIIASDKNFDKKINNLITEISTVLNEPSYEIERKFLIDIPKQEILDSLHAKKIEIEQIYIKSNTNKLFRIRKASANNNSIYTLTSKENINRCKRIENEKKITEYEYNRLAAFFRDNNYATIHKTRYRFLSNNQYFELDIYPFMKNKAILEIELTDENQSIKIPSQLGIAKDITYNDKYKNENIALYKKTKNFNFVTEQSRI